MVMMPTGSIGYRGEDFGSRTSLTLTQTITLTLALALTLTLTPTLTQDDGSAETAQQHGQSVPLAVPLQGAPGGSGQLSTPRKRPAH